MSSGKIVERNIQGFKMFLRPSDNGLSRILNKRQERGEHCFMWILRQEAEGDLGLDIGANIGYTTLPICERMNRVIAIEPDPRTKDLLRMSIEANGFSAKTNICEFAISNKPGKAKMILSKKPNQSSLRPDQKNKVGEIEVTVHTIDELEILPNFIKMDIEGSEVEALQGGMGCLEKTPKCKILIEVHPQFFKDDSFERVLRNLAGMGYTIKYVVSAGVPQPDLFRKNGYEPMKGVPMCMDRFGRHPKRAIYNTLSQDHAIMWSSYSYKQPYSGGISPKIVRSILLVKE